MKSKLAREIELITGISVGVPTIMCLLTVGAWWGVEPIKVFAGYLLGIIGTAALLFAISVHDEKEQAKERMRNG